MVRVMACRLVYTTNTVKPKSKYNIFYSRKYFENIACKIITLLFQPQFVIVTICSGYVTEFNLFMVVVKRKGPVSAILKWPYYDCVN